MTSNLAFSFKCIVGAMTLSIGTDATWSVLLRPLFEELMVFTPEEHRKIFKANIASTTTDIMMMYQQGNKNCLVE